MKILFCKYPRGFGGRQPPTAAQAARILQFAAALTFLKGICLQHVSAKHSPTRDQAHGNEVCGFQSCLLLNEGDIPDATIHTLRELMEPNSQAKFAGDIAKLQGTARHFFETEFASREFEQTKKQVLRRLWGILENQWTCHGLMPLRLLT